MRTLQSCTTLISALTERRYKNGTEIFHRRFT
jgi:hypothetical protein